MACWGWKAPLKDIQLQPPAMGRDPFRQPRVLRAPSNLALNTAREGAATASLGNLGQGLTTLRVKNFFLISSLNLPSFSLKPSPLVLSLHALVKSPSPALLQQVLESCSKVSPQPSLLQAEQPHLSQPFLTAEGFQPSHHCWGPKNEMSHASLPPEKILCGWIIHDDAALRESHRAHNRQNETKLKNKKNQNKTKNQLYIA